MLDRNGRRAAELARRFEAGLAETLAGDLGPEARAGADELCLRLAQALTNEDFLGLCRAWAVDGREFRRILAETE